MELSSEELEEAEGHEGKERAGEVSVLVEDGVYTERVEDGGDLQPDLAGIDAELFEERGFLVEGGEEAGAGAGAGAGDGWVSGNIKGVSSRGGEGGGGGGRAEIERHERKHGGGFEGRGRRGVALVGNGGRCGAGGLEDHRRNVELLRHC